MTLQHAVVNRQTSGFSLVELLAALVILSLIVLLSTQSFSMFSQRWDGRLGSFDDRFEEVRSRWIVRELLTKISPFVVKNPEGDSRFYFEGNRNGFVAVAAQSTSDSRVPAVVRLSFVLAEQGNYDLIYEEWPMVNQYLLTTTQSVEFNEPVLLVADVRNPEFSYLGIPEGVTSMRGDLQPPRWFRQYNSLQTSFHPIAIQLAWETDAGPMSWSIPLLQAPPGQLGFEAQGLEG